MNDISPPRCGPGRMLPLLLTLIVATLSGCSDAEPNAASSEAPSAPLPDAGPIFASEEGASVPSPADATTPSLPDTPASAAEIEASVDTTTIPEAGPSADVVPRLEEVHWAGLHRRDLTDGLRLRIRQPASDDLV